MLLSTLVIDGDTQVHDSEADAASFEPSITRNSYYLLVTDDGLKLPGRVEAVPLYRFHLCRAGKPR